MHKKQICIVYRCADGLLHLAYVIVPDTTGYWNPSSAYEQISALCKIVSVAATPRELKKLETADLKATDLDLEDINPATARKLAATLQECENHATGPKFRNEARMIFVPYAKFVSTAHCNEEEMRCVRLLRFLLEKQPESPSDEEEVSDHACSEPEHEEHSLAIDSAVATPVSEDNSTELAAVPQQPCNESMSSSPKDDASLQTGNHQSLDTSFFLPNLPSNASAPRLEWVDVAALVVEDSVPDHNFFERIAPRESTVGVLTSVEEDEPNPDFRVLWNDLNYVATRYPAEATPLGRACLFRVDH